MEALDLSSVTTQYSQGFMLLDFTQLKPHPLLRPIDESFATKIKQEHILDHSFRLSQPISVIPIKDLEETDLQILQHSSKSDPVTGYDLQRHFLVIDGQHRLRAVELLISQLNMIHEKVEDWHRQLLVQVFSKELGQKEGLLRAWMVFINNPFSHLAPSISEQLLAFHGVHTNRTEVFHNTKLANIALSLRQSCLWDALVQLLRIDVFGRSISPSLLEDWLKYAHAFDFLRLIVIDTVVQHSEICQTAARRLHRSQVQLKYEDFFGDGRWGDGINPTRSGTKERLQELYSEERLNLKAFGYGGDALDEFIAVSLKRTETNFSQTPGSSYLYVDRIVLPDDLLISGNRDLHNLLKKCEVVMSILLVLLFAGHLESEKAKGAYRELNGLVPTWSQILKDELNIKVPRLSQEEEYVTSQIDSLMGFIVANIESFHGIPDSRLDGTLPHLLVQNSSRFPMTLSPGSWAHDILRDRDFQGPWLSMAHFVQHSFGWIPQDMVWVSCFSDNIREMEEEAEAERLCLSKSSSSDGDGTDAEASFDRNEFHDSEYIPIDHQLEFMTLGRRSSKQGRSQVRSATADHTFSPGGTKNSTSISLNSGPAASGRNKPRVSRLNKEKDGPQNVRTAPARSRNPKEYEVERAQKSNGIVSSKKRGPPSDSDLGGDRIKHRRLEGRNNRIPTAKRGSNSSRRPSLVSREMDESEIRAWSEALRSCKQQLMRLLNKN